MYKKSSEKKPKSKQTLAVVIAISVLLAAAIIIPLALVPKPKKEKQVEANKVMKNEWPIPEDEDLEFTEEEHRKLSRSIATQGMVLAVNKGLPLKPTDQVVLFGKGTKETVYGGWGSGQVWSKGTDYDIIPVKVVDGMATKGAENKIKYLENTKGWELSAPNSTVVSNLTEDDIIDFSDKTKTGADRSCAVLTISRLSGEEADRYLDDSETGVKINQNELTTFRALVKYFDHVVVVLNTGSVMEIPDFVEDNKTSIVLAFLPGMESGNAIADVLVGDENPSGHLSDTWAKTIKDYPSTATFTEDLEYVKYKEGLFMGYRYFEDDEEKQSKVVFPFGFGLSYTTFEITPKCTFDDKNQEFEIKAVVKNTGNMKGREVVQIYAEKPQNENFCKVKRELVAFAKTEELPAGESEELIMKFPLSQLASYDETGVTGHKACYVLEEGNYNIYYGTNVADTRGEKNKIYSHPVSKTRVTEKLITRMPPKDPDVADANKKPDFNSFMYKEDEHKYNEQKRKYMEDLKEHKRRQSILFNERKQKREEKRKNEKVDVPFPVFNDINFRTVLEGKNTLEELVETFSDEELAYLTYGHEAKVRGGTGSIGGFYSAGVLGRYLVPGIDTNDGPAGLRQSEVFLQSTAWPCSTMLANTFDVKVMEKVGNETGKEARKIGNSCWLAPGMNIHRNPLCGRNFEYYSEDPLLVGKMAAAIVKGVQSRRVSATIKHFAFNNKEDNRGGLLELMASDSRMAERVAREIYLKGFEIAVKEGPAWSIMTSYNRVNGMQTGECYDLLTGILRKEWKYEGLVMTDWVAISRIARELHAGNNIKMPLNPDDSESVLAALKTGMITRQDLIANDVNILRTISKTAAIDHLYKHNDPIDLTNGNIVNVYNSTYNKHASISYDVCNDETGGYALINCGPNTWVTIMVHNEKAGYRHARIRYAASLAGFGVTFRKGDQNLGEITNLLPTGDGQTWVTSSDFTIYLPEGDYELVLQFLGYDYINYSESSIKGHMNYFEIEKN